ncbi:Uncharacterized protein FWK35_00002431 [Aphis craccivora]|uniref:Uncharacterized protein n=1 Tax=Aphis craccivora TaxID=307492 RepID=A0A6G0ZHF8_APHCR|nr:Uncharacterized protein FWK35_00002431 [Aphis craccivora]
MYINIIIIIDYTYYYTHVDDNNNAVPPVWEIPHVTNLDGTRNYRRRADDHLSLDPREQGARPLFSLFPSEAIILYIEVYSLCIIIFVCIERRYIITPPSKSATTPGRFRHPSPTIYIYMHATRTVLQIRRAAAAGCALSGRRRLRRECCARVFIHSPPSHILVRSRRRLHRETRRRRRRERDTVILL